MLTCREVTERVTEYMERKLSWREWIRFTLHVAMCRVCRRYVSQMETTRTALRRLGQRTRRTRTIDPAQRDAFRAWRDESRQA